MKKLFGMLLLLTFIYITYNFLFVFFEGHHNINYELYDNGKTIKVNEIFNSKNSDSYSINIQIENYEYNLKTNHNYYRGSNIVKIVRVFEEENRQCIFVKYKNDLILNDVICNSNNILYNYSNLINVSSNLDKFISSLSSDGYNKELFSDKLVDQTVLDNINLYHNNMIDNHYLAVSSQKGFYRFNKDLKIKAVNVYNEVVDSGDFYVKSFINNKFVSADYENIELSNYTITNINNSDKYSFKSKKISNTSFIIGEYKKSIYIFDPVSNKEYELDYSTKKLLEVGNADTNILVYKNNKWIRVPLTNDYSNYYFTYYDSDYENDNFSKIDKDEKMGNYYLYKNVNNYYEVYKSDINNKEVIHYLFNTTNIDNIIYYENYIYYIDGTSLKYYSDKTGNKTVLTSNDLFNVNNVLIGLYVK